MTLLGIAFVLGGTVHHFPFLNLRFNISWLLVILMGILVPVFPGALYALGIAWAEEAVGAPFHGALSLSYLTIYLFLRIIHQQIFIEGAASQFLWVLLLTCAQQGIERGLLYWQGYETSPDFLRLLFYALMESALFLALFSFLGLQSKALEKGSRPCL